MDACWTVATQSCLPIVYHSILHVGWCCVSLSAIPSDVVSHYQLCLLMWCLFKGHAFWRGASLSATPVGVVSHYSPCLLMWCLTIAHAFRCGASLSAMSAGVLPQYRPCLLVWCLIITCLLLWCLTIGHVFWCGAALSALSAISAGVVITIGDTFWCGTSLSGMHVGVVPHYRPCLLVNRHCNRHFTSRRRRMVASLVLLLQRCHYIRHVC